jgi:hypothetical protein
MPDKSPHFLEGHWPAAAQGEAMIGGAPQIGRGVDERPVEIEDNGFFGHGAA